MSKQSQSQSDSSRSSSSSSRSSIRYDQSSKYSEKNDQSIPIYICLEQDIANAINNEIYHLKNKYSIESIEFDKSLQIPGQNKEILKILDKNLKKKISLIDDLLIQISQQMSQKIQNSENKLDFQILVPDDVVSILIEKEGKNLRRISDQSQSIIKVEPRQGKFQLRQVCIQGKTDHLIKAIQQIYAFIEKRDDNQNYIMNNYGEEKTTAKFVFDERAMGFLIGKRGFNIKEINNNNKVQCKIVSYDNFQCTYRDDSVIIINGPLRKVILACEDILQRIDDYYKKNNKNFSDYSMKIIMNTNHVNKLIGTGGKLIQDIAKKSGAPQIKILSDEKNKNHECIVKVMGSLKNKQYACEMILKYLESFKSGGQISIEKNHRIRSRTASRSFSKKKKTQSRSRSQKKSRFRVNSFKENSISKDIKKQKSPSKDTKIIKFTSIISVKMMQKMVENDNFIFKKIQQESQSSLQILPMDEDDTLYLEIKGNVESIKLAINIIIDEQQKLE